MEKYRIHIPLYNGNLYLIDTKDVMTAVEWLLENLITEPYSEAHFKHNSECWDKAEKMEKQQIMDAWIATDNELQRIAALQYYNETFKSEQHFTCRQFIADNKTSSATKCICGKEKFEHI